MDLTPSTSGASAGAVVVILPSGRTAQFRPGKGRDLIAAQRVAKTPDEVAFALISVLATIDGAPIVYEDLLEMDLPDVLKLQEAVAGNFTQTPKTSSTSATSQAGATLT
jgi:hypothetical protein